MKKTKMEKGITLIALIITIVVLLILAVVTIGAIRNSKIITHAQNSADEWKKSQTKENEILDSYLDKIELNLPKHNNIGIAKVGEIVNENSTIDGKAYSSDNPVIPAGFMAVNVTTEGQESYWDAEDGPQVSEGLVISDGINEFVWIPVESGVLPDINEDGSEPEVVTDDNTRFDSDSSNLVKAGMTEGSTAEQFKSQLENEYNAMTKSVAYYKGFYVGRYEVSIGNNGKAQSLAGVLPATTDESSADTWYGLYKLCKTYQTSSVKSSMIWGGQYEAIMYYIGTNEATTKGRVSHNLSSVYLTGGIDGENGYSGTIKYNDIIKNIYDLEGNAYEMTQEATYDYYRVRRSGAYSVSFEPKEWAGDRRRPIDAVYDAGCRFTLYIEL